MDGFPTLAAIDAGSNAVRVLIAQLGLGDQLVPIFSERVPVRLGRGTFTNGALDAQTIDEAITAFARFKKLFVEHDVRKYRAVATSALRNASNRETLIDRCFRELELDIEVINGKEEARLIQRAVSNELGDETPQTIMDLGGGSLEILTPRSKKRWGAKSLKVGTVRLLESFEIKDEISDDEYRMIKRYVKTALKQAYDSPPSIEDNLGIAAMCGGNAEALGDLFGEKNESGTSVVSVSTLAKNLESITSLSTEERMSTFGFRQDRAEVIGIAAIVFATIAKQLDLKELVVPRVGLREGVLLEFSQSSRTKLATPQEPQSYWAARSFAERLGHNLHHGENIRHLATKLFRDLQELHGLTDSYEVILGIAALLHDVGEVVHRRGHHKHSEYLIQNGRMPGLDDNDRLMAAAVARAHRGNDPDERKHDSFAELAEGDQKAVSSLAAILRVADCFDTDHRQQVVGVDTKIKSKKVVFSVKTKKRSSLVEGNLRRKSELFCEIFDRRVEFEFIEASSKSKR